MKYEFNRNEFNWAEEFYDVLQKKWGYLIGLVKMQMLCGIC